MDSVASCRGCMRGLAGRAPLLATEERLRRMFSFCTGVRLERDDELSLHICIECIRNVHSCYNFINTCRKTDDRLRRFSTKNVGDELAIKQEHTSEPPTDRISATSPTVIDEHERLSVSETNHETKPASAIAVQHECDVTHATDNSNHKIYRSSFKTKRKKIKRVHQTCRATRTVYSATDRIEFVSDQTQKWYVCPICANVLSCKKSLNLHIAEQHSDCRKYVCNYCSKVFLNSKKLAKHLTVHSRKAAYTCSVCSKSYSHKSLLSEHTQIHSNRQPYKCDICSKNFLSRSGMINHSKQHEQDNHLCHLCGQKFTQIGNLNVHIRVHTGEKPYVCSICPFRCSVQSGMRRHERTHYDSRPHTCTICHKSFNNSGILVRHKRIHTGELPYECAYCSKAFIDSWKRKTHLVKVHNIPLANIPPMLPGRKRAYSKRETELHASNIKLETENV